MTGVVAPRPTRVGARRRAAALLDQQLWCWGRDVARPAGNVLVGLGMCRYRSGGLGEFRTAYTGAVAGGVVWLWGFGLLYCRPGLGGVFLRRYRFDPLLVERPPESPAFRPSDLGPLTRPASAVQRATAGTLVRAAAAWAAEYEHWVAEEFGPAYRAMTLAARGEPPAVPPAEMARAWGRLAKKASRLAATGPASTGPWAKLLAALHAPAAPPAAARPRPSWTRRL